MVRLSSRWCAPAILAVAATLPALEQPLTKPGNDLAVLPTEHLRVVVPAEQAEALRPLAARAEAIYQRLAHDAGVAPKGPLTVIISDDVEDHNGYSTVVPTPVVQVELAPSLPRSGIFCGTNETERTLLHEFTHHLSNDRNHGFRGVLESIFGRIWPSDILSLTIAYLSTPAHVTMPSFWHEGLAQWAETQYADPTSAWAGRGRDSLTHMVWRLDAEAGAIPTADTWRSTWHRWPYGNAVYLYGLAYTRYLQARYGDRPGLWAFVDCQARAWAFEFQGAPRSLVGADHAVLIEEARWALAQEQREQLARLRQVPVTPLTRLTPTDGLVSAPAWLPDGRLLTTYQDPYNVPSLAIVDDQGHLVDLDESTWDRGEVRSAADGTAIWAEASTGLNPWARSRLSLRLPDGALQRLSGERFVQPDVRRLPDAALQVTAIHLLPAGRTALMVGTVATSSWGTSDVTWTTVPVQGRPWHPTFRPGSNDLTWVETDAAGSRLVMAPLTQPTQRTVLAEVRGRLLHPSWTADGRRVYVCADHTGVANAWAVEADRPGVLRPVTHVIGGVVACVPSPDGATLAVVAYDRNGNFLARIPADERTWPASVPSLTLAWPAPLSSPAAPAAPAPLVPREAPVGPTQSYRGLTELRPLFWTPTTQVTPAGGLGVVGVAADPLQTHEVIAAAGIGSHDTSPVGLLAYTCAAYPAEVGVVAWREEHTYNDQLLATTGERFDLVDDVGTVELRVGRGLAGSHHRLQVYAAGGHSWTGQTAASRQRTENATLINQTPFSGQETYVQGTVAFSSNLLFPTSYTWEDGTNVALIWRRSGFGGDLAGQRVVGRGSHTISVWPEAGHQLVLGGLVGWTSADATRTLQGRFAVGQGDVYGVPRGYPNTMALGDYLQAWSAAYRVPVWRPFQGIGTGPVAVRQVVAEGFLEGAKASRESLRDPAPWYRAAGAELHLDAELWALRMAPGVGAAHQLDGEEATVGYLTLGFAW